MSAVKCECGFSNSTASKFCGGCGRSLAAGPKLCSACGTPAQPNARFCENCAAPLSTDATGEGRQSVVADPPPEPTPQNELRKEDETAEETGKREKRERKEKARREKKEKKEKEKKEKEEEKSRKQRRADRAVRGNVIGIGERSMRFAPDGATNRPIEVTFGSIRQMMRAARFVHVGDRVEVIGKIQSDGTCTPDRILNVSTGVEVLKRFRFLTAIFVLILLAIVAILIANLSGM